MKKYWGIHNSANTILVIAEIEKAEKGRFRIKDVLYSRGDHSNYYTRGRRINVEEDEVATAQEIIDFIFKKYRNQI